ncbi:Hypothetical predicted protein [Paramuricea clavata]|uniref:Uncharacterized protein n=1 Tax=Paramuricea clavata TaxID=317549 RepID=A0A7D9L7N4_PARCT|nr:Hypothetical predicted protein [Paramuricea clavata]
MAATVQLYKCGFCTNIFVDLASARTHKCTGKGVQPKLQNASVPPSQTQTQKGGKSSVPKPQAGDHSVTMPLNAPVPPSQTQKQGNSSVTKPQNVSFPPLESRTQQAGKSSVTVPLNASVPQSQMQQAGDILFIMSFHCMSIVPLGMWHCTRLSNHTLFMAI